MPIIIQLVDPQPVLADPKPPGRWIWSPTKPITDMCKGGNSTNSWWNNEKMFEDEPPLSADDCPVARPPKAKVTMALDSADKWVWIVTWKEKKK